MKLLFTILSFHACLLSCSVLALNTDSLRSICNDSMQSDTNRVEAMKKLIWENYIFSKPDSAYYFAQLEYDLAHDMGSFMYMADALSYQAISFYMRGNYPSAIEHFSKSIDLCKLIDNKEIMASNLTGMGNVYYQQGIYGQAIEHYTQSLDIHEEIGNNIGMASNLNNIGGIYQEQKEYVKALDYFTQSLALRSDYGDKQGMADVLCNIGGVYQEKRDYKMALDYYSQSLILCKEINYKRVVAISLMNIGVIYAKQGDTLLALEQLGHSIKLNEELGNKPEIALVLINLGNIYYSKGDYKTAISCGEKALKLSQESGTVLKIKDASHNLYLAFKQIGANAKALEMYELYINMRDSIINEENTKRIVQLEAKMEYEHKLRAQTLELEKKEALQGERFKRYIYKHRCNFVCIFSNYWGILGSSAAVGK